MTTDTKLEMYRGDTPTWRLTVTDRVTGLPFDLTNCTLWMTAKWNKDDLDVAAVFQISSTGGAITIVPPSTDGIALITPQRSSTSALTTDARLVYDVQVKTQAGLIYTVLAGTLVVTRDVTQSS